MAGWPGRAHDARVGRMVMQGSLVRGNHTLTSTINEQAIEPFLIRDPKYPLSKHLMKDYGGFNLSPEKQYYNYRLNRARIQIERIFGMLKGRWRCLLRPLDCDLENFVGHVIACCILHNICQEGDAEYLAEWDVHGDDEIVDLPALGPVNDHFGTDNAEQIRNVLVQYVAEN